MAATTQDNANKEIDKGVAGLYLGLGDISDLDFQTYKTLLRERIAAARMGDSSMDSGDVEVLTKEFVRIKKIDVVDAEPKKKIDTEKFVNKIKKEQKEQVRQEKTAAKKIFATVDSSPTQKQQEKVSPKALLPAAKPEVEQDEQAPEGLDDLLNDIRSETDEGIAAIVPTISKLQDSMDSILETLTKQQKLDKKEEKEEDALAAKQKRTGREEKLEGKGKKEKDNSKSMKDKVVKPVKGIFDTLMDFFKNILLGGALLFLVNALKDPQKYLQPFVDALNRVLEFFNGIIRAMNGFIENFNKFVLGPINDFILKPIHSSLNYIEDRINDVLGLFGADPLNNIDDEPPGLAIPKIPEIPPYDPFKVLPEGATTAPPVQQSYQGGEVVNNEYVTNNTTTINRYEEGGNVTNNNAGNILTINNDSSMNMGGVSNTMGNTINNIGGASNTLTTGGNITNNTNVKGFNEGGGVTSNSGQKITGAGPDTQLIAAQPGEIVMSRGAVSKYGAGNLLAMNSAGGGNNTPRMTNNVQMANGGGTVINAQGFSGGGLVGGTAGSPRNPKQRKIYLHWSGGFHNSPSGRYHQIFGGSGQPLNPQANYGADKNNHTGLGNQDSVGLAVAAMGHRGMDKKYDEHKGWAENPPTSAQVNALAKETAGIMRAYGQTAADVNKNVMTHGEFERQGVKSGGFPGGIQRWDLDSLKPPGPNGDYGHPGGFYTTQQVKSKGGDTLRSKIRSFLGGGGDDISDETPKMSMKLERPDGMKQQHFEMFGSMDAEFRSELASAQIGDKVSGLTVTKEIRAEVKRYNLALTKHTQMMAKNPQEIGGGGGSTAAISSTGSREAPGPRVDPNVDAFLLPGSGGVPKNATPTSSAAGGGKNVVPNFSSIDGMNGETLIIKSIYNMVG